MVMTESSRAPRAVPLLSQVTCAHCWERFPTDQVNWISEHADLMDDPLLVGEHQRRFLPSRFTAEGDAVDPQGLTCTRLACPKCHLELPRAMLESAPLFVSIFGSAYSGKSYLLTSMIYQLRSLLAEKFSTTFTDADTRFNQRLNLDEGKLFLSETPDEVCPLDALIEKTQMELADLYSYVRFGKQTVRYPRPFLFSLRPKENHPNFARARDLSRVLCLYDNAGEHFEPDKDTTDTPVTRHLARSQVLMFVFDPTQDQKFRTRCRHGEGAGGSNPALRTSRQEIILNEAASRVRRYGGLPTTARLDRPLIVVLTKCDEWAHLLDVTINAEPWARYQGQMHALLNDSVRQRSDAIRRLMLKFRPEIVQAAEDFAKEVVFVAVSALGPELESLPYSATLGIRPSRIRPIGVAVPILHGLSRVLPGLVPSARTS
jgi:hypothetical protein